MELISSCLFSGPLGPPSHPADMNLGIMNDGSIADVYREHPVLWTYQTTGNGGEEWMGEEDVV